jgi:hypothetical protein
MGHKLVTACFICTLWNFLNKNLFCKFWLCSYFVIYCRRRWWRKSTSCWWMWWRTEVRILRPIGGTEGSMFYFLVTLSRSPNGTGLPQGHIVNSRMYVLEVPTVTLLVSQLYRGSCTCVWSLFQWRWLRWARQLGCVTTVGKCGSA